MSQYTEKQSKNSSHQEVVYEGKENITIEDFLKTEKVLKNSLLSKPLFLRYIGETLTTNIDRIWSKYEEGAERESYAGQYKSGVLPYIKPNTTVLIPRSLMELETTLLYGINQFYTHKDYPAFWGENQEKLKNSDGFVAHQKLEFRGGTSATLRNENIRVYVVRRSDQGAVIEDLTPNIVSCNTSKNFNVGTFNIAVVDKPNYAKDISKNEVISYANIDGVDTDHSPNVGSYYSNVIGNNDLVFIRFEQLLLEKENYTGDSLTPQSLASYSSEDDEIKRTWDMIGLVSNVSTNYNSTLTDRTITINGQDLTKLLSDDGSYFIPLRFVEGSNKRFFFGGNSEDGWFKRNVIDGSYDNYWFSYKLKSIRETIGFVANHLSNIGIVNDRVFDGYGDRRSTVYELDKEKQKYKETKAVKGVWQIIKFFIDEASEDRRVADSSFVNPEGTLLEFFQRICQQPFVEFFGDTYLDTFDFIVRKPPFDAAAIQGVVERKDYIEIDNSDLYNYNLYYDERNYSWYQIQPQNGLWEDDGYTSLTYLPIIYFSQMAEAFGNKKLVVPNNYISKEALDGNQATLHTNTFIRKMLNDYIYMIESNIYLPFTRKGSITLNGDRRIKVGTFVKLNKTNELFYVTSVNQSGAYGSQIDRTTTIQVERGMIFQYIKGVGSTSIERQDTRSTTELSINVNSYKAKINYFNILNSELIKETILFPIEQAGRGLSVIEKEKATFGLNEGIFNFFLNRNQLKYNADNLMRIYGLEDSGEPQFER